MDLKQLPAAGAFVPRTLFKKTIPIKRPELKPKSEWADPDVEEFTGKIIDDSLTAWIRKRNSADFMEMRGAPNRDKMHIMVFRCVCHEDGSPVFESLEQAEQLKDWLFVPLAATCVDVNDGGAAKNSQPRTSSGVVSPSASAGARLRSGARRSARKNSSATGSPTKPSAAP